MDDVARFSDEVARFQREMSGLLQSASAALDKDLPTRIREQGETLARMLHGLVRLTRVYAPDNRAFDQPVHEFRTALARLLELLGDTQLVALDDQLYLNDIRLRFREGDATGAELGMELARHRVGGMTFHAPVDPGQVRTLALRLAAPSDPERPRGTLAAALRDSGIDGLDLFGPFRYQVSGEDSEPRSERVRRLVSRAHELVDTAYAALGWGRMPNALPIKRIVAAIVEAGAGSAGIWDEPDGASPQASHTLRVCQLALIVGEAAGLDASALQDLGVSAMFHDVGYTEREGAGRGSAGYPPPFERHPAAGGRLLLRQRGFGESKVRRLLATLHHHRPLDDGRGPPHLFGRILRIAEDYDTWTRPRGGGHSPHAVLERMASCTGTVYDRPLFQLFVNAMGAYPPGTLLLLADGRTVCSASMVRNPETFSRPRTRVVALPDGEPVAEESWVDLALEGEIAEVVP